MKPGVNEKAINTANPIGDEVVVEVAIPKLFKIRMVEASKFVDFKIWSAITAVLSNIFVGFLVAAITNNVAEKQTLLWCVSGLFCIMMLGALSMTIWMDSKMKTQETIINLKATR